MPRLTSERYLEVVTELAEQTVRPYAASVDRDGRFPREAIKALQDAGVLGLVSATEVGGSGLGIVEATRCAERLAGACASTAMIVCMHFSAVRVIESRGSLDMRRGVATGRQLLTLAFSEVGSRSHFWAPVGSARRDGDCVRLNARKSFVTSAQHATAFVWSSKPVAAEGASTLWLVPNGLEGLRIASVFDGLGLRGNDSAAVTAEDALVQSSQRLGEDGEGFAIMMQDVLPWFNLMCSGISLGLMAQAVQITTEHVASTGFEHTGSRLSELPTVRANLARMRVKTDALRSFLYDCAASVASGGEGAQLAVLESKAVANETAQEVLDLAMRVCGGGAFRRDFSLERLFRDTRAGMVMAPTVDVLYDFIGKALTGISLF